jgi:hypothetical protein
MALLTQGEKDALKVIKYGISEAENVPSLAPVRDKLDGSIASSEALLSSLGRKVNAKEIIPGTSRNAPPTIKVRSFDELLLAANDKYPQDISFSDILSAQEIGEHLAYIEQLNEEFNSIHKLDKVDIIISAVAGVLGGVIDSVFGGFVQCADGKNMPGALSQFVRKLFNKALTPERIKKLEQLAKVSYDALNYDNNGNVIVGEIVDGLSAYFHHFVSLGHDPILGFIFGVLDMLRGTVTTLGFNGKFLVQAADGYSNRKAKNLFEAIATVFLHMLSDVNGSSSKKNDGMGLPVPFMALFNLFQFGKVGGHNTISELVKSMFYQGYDFRHFCAMSIPVMITEVIVRVSYFAKRLHEGRSFIEALPVGQNHAKKPKLGTMLFIAHSANTAINAGKIWFTHNPLNINYPQWLSFARYSVKQLKWALVEKPNLRHKHVMDIVNEQWDSLYNNLDSLWDEFTEEATIVYV